MTTTTRTGLVVVSFPVPGALNSRATAGYLWARSWFFGPPPGAVFVPLSPDTVATLGKRVVRKAA